MSFSERLKELREEKELTQTELGKIFNLSKQAISSYEKGGSAPGQESLKRIADFFNVSIDYLLGHTNVRVFDIVNIFQSDDIKITASGKPLTQEQRLNLLRILDNATITSAPNTIPILGTIRAGIPILARENWGDMLEIPSDITASFALEVKGDSMIGAGIHEGDYAICRETDQANSGSIVVALKDIDPEISEATLKYYFSENGRGILRAANPEYEDIVISEKHRITGVMVSLLRKRPTPVSYYKDYISIKDYKLTPWNDVIEKAISYGIKPDKVKSIIEMHWEMINKQ